MQNSGMSIAYNTPKNGCRTMDDTARTAAVLLFLVGLALRTTDVLDIVHEFFHFAVANSEGKEAHIAEWNKTIVYGKRSFAFIYGGYIGEYLLYSVLVFIFATGGKPVLGWFWYGILFTVWLKALWSTDFNDTNRLVSETGENAIQLLWFAIGAGGMLVLQFTLRYYYRYYKDLSSRKGK